MKSLYVAGTITKCSLTRALYLGELYVDGG